ETSTESSRDCSTSQRSATNSRAQCIISGLGVQSLLGKGYPILQEDMSTRLTMLADPEQPTRLGNSVSRDTCPTLRSPERK
ncbi:hypothetical protein HPB47_003960, partial [Ixodes persulcatus]